jgi:hypothetical protein
MTEGRTRLLTMDSWNHIRFDFSEEEKAKLNAAIVGEVICPQGCVLTKLWYWFIIPIFHLPTLAVWPAVGIVYIVGFLAHDNPKEERKMPELIGIGIIGPFLTLGFGWLIHWMIR